MESKSSSEAAEEVIRKNTEVSIKKLRKATCVVCVSKHQKHKQYSCITSRTDKTRYHQHEEVKSYYLYG